MSSLAPAAQFPQESTRTINFLLVAPPTVGKITNTVTVDPNNAIYEADETNNTFTQETTVATGIDLVIRKDDSPVDPPGIQNVTEGFDPIATSGTETYVVTVDNDGTQDVTGITVRDTLPADTNFLSVVADPDHGFTCAIMVGHRRHRDVHRRPSDRGRKANSTIPPGLLQPDRATISPLSRSRYSLDRPTERCITKCSSIRTTTIAEYNELNNFEYRRHDRHQRRCITQCIQRTEHRQGTDQSGATGGGSYQRHAHLYAYHHQRRHRSGREYPCPRLPADRCDIHRGGGYGAWT